MVIADLVGLLVAAAAGWAAAGAGFDPLGQEYALAAAFVTLSLGAYWAAGLYPGVGISGPDELRLLTRTTTMVWGSLLVALVVLQSPVLATAVVLTWLVALVAVPAVRSFVRAIAMRARWWGVPVVILGAGQAASLLVWRLQHFHPAGLKPVALFDDDPLREGTQVHGVPVVGPLAGVAAYRERGIRHALVAMPSLEPRQLTKVVREHLGSFPAVMVLPDLVGFASIGVTARSLGGMVGMHVKQNLLVRENLLMKRLLDLVVLVPAALVAAPLVGIFALVVRMSSPGSAFYSQEREGLGGRRFRMWKLRTMYVDAEERLEARLAEDAEARERWNTHFKLNHDPRIVPGIGAFLRKTSLDELPQLWNIFRGQMSFVGPRPFPEYHLAAFDDEFRALRRQVLPGLTGLWQVNQRSEADLSLQRELDSLYIANWSLWMDIYVLARTPGAVMAGRGAY